MPNEGVTLLLYRIVVLILIKRRFYHFHPFLLSQSLVIHFASFPRSLSHTPTMMGIVQVKVSSCSTVSSPGLYTLNSFKATANNKRQEEQQEEKKMMRKKSVINKMKIIIRDYLQTSTQYIFLLLDYLLLLLLYVDNLFFFFCVLRRPLHAVLLIHTLQQPPQYTTLTRAGAVTVIERNSLIPGSLQI